MRALTIQGLRKVYPTGAVALKEVNLSVEKGDFFALLGVNGAGKSTTIGIITSLIKKTKGHVKIFDYDLDHTLDKAKSCIGLVPQEVNFSLFDKVIDVLIYQAGYYGVPYLVAKERAEKYLKKLGLWGKHTLPCMQLSGGMKRRLMIARALMHEPPLLILDEPTAGVDIEIRSSIWEFLKEMNQQGTTIILTTHYLEEAETLCKNIAILDQGEIIRNTSMRALLSHLNTETFVLDLKAPLEKLPEQSAFKMKLIDPYQLEVEIEQSKSINQLFLTLQDDIEVTSMRNKKNRLEALFLDLVNKK